jgi:hypothetical protein
MKNITITLAEYKQNYNGSLGIEIHEALSDMSIESITSEIMDFYQSTTKINTPMVSVGVVSNNGSKVFDGTIENNKLHGVWIN